MQLDGVNVSANNKISNALNFFYKIERVGPNKSKQSSGNKSSTEKRLGGSLSKPPGEWREKKGTRTNTESHSRTGSLRWRHPSFLSALQSPFSPSSEDTCDKKYFLCASLHLLRAMCCSVMYWSKTAAVIASLWLHMMPTQGVISSGNSEVFFSPSSPFVWFQLLLIKKKWSSGGGEGISLSILVVFSLVQTLQAAGLGHAHHSSQTLNLSTPVDQQIT